MSEFDDFVSRAGLKLQPKTIDDDGRIIDCDLNQAMEDWASGKWILFKDNTAAGRLSTVFIGQLFSNPAYFETMLFAKEGGDNVQGRYKTYAEAKAGHEALKKKFS